MKFKIYTTNPKSEEFKTIKHFLLWHGLKPEIEKTNKTLKFSMGKSLIHVIIFSKDNEPMVGFNHFHGLYNWFKTNGMFLI